MGRGRAKAKQAKVARELKYSSHEPDLEKLQEELSGTTPRSERDEHDDEDEYDAMSPPERSSR